MTPRSPAVVLREGREKSVQQRHPWVFSGAVLDELGDPKPGSLVAVRAQNGAVLGFGAYNPHSGIRVRMLFFGESRPTDPAAALLARIDEAAALRAPLADTTDAYRLVNAEGDRLPGLTIDRYADTLVVQPGALYLEPLLERLTARAMQHAKAGVARLRIEKGVRDLEGLTLPDGPYMGEPERFVHVTEHGLRYKVDIEAGQKTGLFLDQRDNRLLVRRFATDARVLNLFGYTGGFSLNAEAAGAAHVTTVDASGPALRLYRENRALNGFTGAVEMWDGDTAHWFRDLDPRTRFDVVVCDPPAFAKTRDGVIEAARAYKDVNRRAMQLIDRGVLLTFSCSSHVPAKLFRQVAFQAGVEAGRAVRVLGALGPGLDHPVDLYHPEGEYLKGLLLDVRRD